eukprot:42535-Hanusia_phi.AAC.1
MAIYGRAALSLGKYYTVRLLRSTLQATEHVPGGLGCAISNPDVGSDSKFECLGISPHENRTSIEALFM